MNLLKKKNLAAKVFGVGKSRIVFSNSRIGEIKEAITKQDMRDLKASGAISIRETKGRRKAKEGSRRMSFGNTRKNVSKRKRNYAVMTRKLRGYLDYAKDQGNISKDEYDDMRKKIKNRFFKHRTHMKEYIGGVKK